MKTTIRPTCPGSSQPVNDPASVVATRLGHAQRIGTCRHCGALVLTRDGVAIEHLLKEELIDELGSGHDLPLLAEETAAPAGRTARHATTPKAHPARPRPSKDRATNPPAATAPEPVTPRRTLRERLVAGRRAS